MDIKELHSFKMSDAVKFHDKLNPNLWRNNHLDPAVRKQLIVIAEDFLSNMGISGLDVKDITVSGSSAAYSYTPHSDLDLHILVDMSKLPNDEVYRELFTAKKTIYNDSHDIKVKGVPVELYVQDSNQPVVSLGEYSILNDKWLKIPSKRRANLDQNATKAKYDKLAGLVDLALKSRNLERVKETIKTIKRYRQAGLDTFGEFGPENLAYKAVRSQGAIDALYKLRDELHGEELSIEEMYSGPKMKFLRPGELKGSYSDYDLLRMGFKKSQNGSWYIPQTKWDKLVAAQQIGEEISDQNKITLSQLYKDGKPDRDEIIWDYGTMIWDTLYEIQSIGAYKLAMLLCDQYNVEFVEDLFERMSEEQHEIVDKYINDPSLSNKIIVMDNGYIVDGNHRAIAAAVTKRPIKYIDINDEEEDLAERYAKEFEGYAGNNPAIGKVKTLTARDIKGKYTDDQLISVGFKKEPNGNFTIPLLKWNKLRSTKKLEDYDPNGPPPGPEFKPTMPAGTVKVDVTDVYDWYKLGQHISNLKGLGKHDFGKGPPSTIMSFGSEPEEHEYIKDLEKTGLSTTDIDPVDPNQPKGMKRQKVDPTYNVSEDETMQYAAEKIAATNPYGGMKDRQYRGGISEASGYIPSEKEKNDPRWSMALTKDVRPNAVKKNAKAFSWLTNRAGVPPQARPDGKVK